MTLTISDHFADPILDDLPSREIDIDNRSNSSELTDYQVNVDVSNHVNQQGIRFVDENLQIIDYWEEDSNTIWAEIPKIIGSKVSAVRLMHGDIDSKSDGEATFNFFDDVETGDKTNWTEENGGIEVVTDSKNGIYAMRSNQGSGGTGDFTIGGYAGNSETDFIYEGWVKPIGNDWGGLIFRRSATTTFYISWFNPSGNAITLTKMLSGSRNDITSGSFTCSLGTWYKYKIIVSGTSIKIDIDGNNTIDTTDSDINTGYVGIGGYKDTNNREVVVDDIRVRKYTSPEPTAVIA